MTDIRDYLQGDGQTTVYDNSCQEFLREVTIIRLIATIFAWRECLLEQAYPYLIIDATYLYIRNDGSL